MSKNLRNGICSSHSGSSITTLQTSNKLNMRWPKKEVWKSVIFGLFAWVIRVLCSIKSHTAEIRDIEFNGHKWTSEKREREKKASGAMVCADRRLNAI